MQELIVQMNEKEKLLVKISSEKGLSNWLTMLPITEYGIELSKQQFWDSVRLRYGRKIVNLRKRRKNIKATSQKKNVLQ